MAGTQLIKKKLKASAILEAIVAMVIILVVFGMAMAITAKVIQSGPSVQATRAHAILEDLLLKTEADKKFESGQQVVDSLLIRQTVKPADNGNVIEIELEARDGNQKVLAHIQKLERP